MNETILFRDWPTNVAWLNQGKIWYTWIEIRMKDWSVLVPDIYVEWIPSETVDRIMDMQGYFETLYKGKWIINTLSVADSPNMLWFTDWSDIKSWEQYRGEIFTNIDDPKIAKIIKWLNNEWISADILNELLEDFNHEKNEKLFRDFIELFIDDKTEKAQTLKALEICIKAHEWQVQEKDNNWLDHIPYHNHSIRIAMWALVIMKEPAYIVQAYLLHDVVEDTEYNIEFIKREFWDDVVDIVDDVTQRPEETREQYMDRINKLTNTHSKRLKSLDRYHNLLRALCRTKESYLERYIKESEEIYLGNFEKDEDLWRNFYVRFKRTLEELKSHLDHCKAR